MTVGYGAYRQCVANCACNGPLNATLQSIDVIEEANLPQRTYIGNCFYVWPVCGTSTSSPSKPKAGQHLCVLSSGTPPAGGEYPCPDGYPTDTQLVYLGWCDPPTPCKCPESSGPEFCVQLSDGAGGFTHVQNFCYLTAYDSGDPCLLIPSCLEVGYPERYPTYDGGWNTVCLHALPMGSWDESSGVIPPTDTEGKTYPKGCIFRVNAPGNTSIHGALFINMEETHTP